MDPSRPLAIGASIAGGALALHQRRRRKAVERFAAAALETVLNAIEANDRETGLHVRRVAAYALVIARAAGLSESEQHGVERVALFHDIGKIHEALFDVVHEHRKLRPAERRAILTHPRRGARVLAPLAAFYPELPAGVLAHHEWWDGGGYPRGLRGRAIPLEARIVAIADTFDAISHTRRYRRGRGVSAAIDAIANGRGTQFDPELADLALLPPVLRELSREPRVAAAKRAGRRAHRREPVPDVAFRWRSPAGIR